MHIVLSLWLLSAPPHNTTWCQQWVDLSTKESKTMRGRERERWLVGGFGEERGVNAEVVIFVVERPL